MPETPMNQPNAESSICDCKTAVGTTRLPGLIPQAHRGEIQRDSERVRQGFARKKWAAELAGQLRWDEALGVYADAESVCGDDWEFHNNYANALKAVGRREQAVGRYERARALRPQALEPHYNLGLALLELGRTVEAEASLERALALDPLHGLANLNLANLLNVQHRLAEAERHYLLALAARPEDAKLFNNFGQVLAKARRFAEAEACYRRAIELEPRYATAMSNLAELLAQHGRMDDAAVLLRVALEAEPANAAVFSNLLFTLAHTSDLCAERLLAEHRAFAERFERPLRAAWREHGNSREAERPLRVGMISADLRDHPVVRYLRPALARLRMHVDLTLVAYNNSTQRDAETERYKAAFHEWNDVAHESDAALAQRIEADRIDVLMDLSGHTGFNRLLTLARRPAPVQVSWMGYVATTGLESVDYFVADRLLVPDEMAWQFTEKLLRLPATTSFAPVEDAPAVNELPTLQVGVFTFSSLARMNKLNRETVRVWAEILRRAAGSRMLLAALPDGSEPDALIAWFAEEGIGRERLAFAHTRSVADVLRVQHEVDLSLDTFPYNGSTSNSHALWMGVPTLTLAGETAAGRMGASLALQNGLQEFVAHTTEEYVALAVRWAADQERLSALRSGLRARFAASVLQDHALIADALADKLREAWRRWCAGLPPESL